MWTQFLVCVDVPCLLCGCNLSGCMLSDVEWGSVFFLQTCARWCYCVTVNETSMAVHHFQCKAVQHTLIVRSVSALSPVLSGVTW